MAESSHNYASEKDIASDNKSSEKDDNFETILLKEYDYVSRLFIENEQLGERRVELFNALTTAVLAMLGAISGSGILLMGKEADPKLFLIGSMVLFSFGIFTLRRIIQRNIATDQNTIKLDSIRKYFVKEETSEKIAYLPFDPESPKPPHRIEPGVTPLFSLGRGGLLENVVLMNSFIFAGLVVSLFALLPLETEMIFVILAYGLIGLLVFVGSWLGQMIYTRGKYDDEIIRAAGGLVWRYRNNSKEIAVVHRTRYAEDEWILPKGKLKSEKGESWKEAAIREVCEEIGCTKKDLKVGERAGEIFYTVEKKPKVVLFWNMTLEADGDLGKTDIEVDKIKWLPKTEAADLLIYEKERALLRQQD